MLSATDLTIKFSHRLNKNENNPQVYTTNMQEETQSIAQTRDEQELETQTLEEL